MIKEKEVKTILTKVKNSDYWLGYTYNANFYRGCTHQCIYCDSRSECYGIEDFNDIEVKINSIDILRKELAGKRIKGTIGTGAMSDPYMPVEKKYRLTRKFLELCLEYNFPVLITTKSDLVLEDIELLKKINSKTKATVIFTITTVDDLLAKKIEPFATLPTQRLNAMKKLNEEGIYTGVLLMPVLPFILDNKENICDIITCSFKSGAKFIYPYFGVTLRDRQREYFYRRLDDEFPTKKAKYIKLYGNKYSCNSPDSKELYNYFKSKCHEYDISYNTKNIETWEKQNKEEQLSMEI